VLGFRSPDTVWLEAPWWLGLPIVLAIGASCTGLRRRAWTPLFHVLIVVAPLLFLLSGSFIDAQSYRYLMPAAGALAVVMAIGVSNLFNRSRLAGTATLTLLLALFLFEQAAWYRQLTPDTGSAVLISCLDQANVRAAYADYWLSYKLTFLTGERIIVAPNSGVDRYPPYTAYVRTQPAAPTISLASGTTCADELSPGR
jgi:hypothetical protein